MPSEAEPNPTFRRIVVESDFAVLDRIVEEADAFARACGADEDLAYRVVLLTTEAVTNAIEHGNALDPAKSVVVEFSSPDDRIEVRVRDEGSGFSREALRNPLAEENLLSEGGRGIFLIESMADEFSFERDGREIRMAFHVTNAAD